MKSIRQWLIPATLGALAVLAVQWAYAAYTTHIIHAPADRKHAQPDFTRITQLGNRVVPELCFALDESWQARPERGNAGFWSWTVALGNIKDRRSVPTLIALTDHKDPLVRQNAVLALTKINDPRSLPALKRLTKDPDSRVAEVAQSAVGSPNEPETPTERTKP